MIHAVPFFDGRDWQQATLYPFPEASDISARRQTVQAGDEGQPAIWQRSPSFRIVAKRWQEEILSIKALPEFCCLIHSSSPPMSRRRRVRQMWSSSFLQDVRRHETVGYQLSWCICCLIQLPECLRKVQEEVDQVMGAARIPAARC